MTEWVAHISRGWIFGQEFLTWIEGIGFRSILQTFSRGFPGGSSGKESACQCRRCKRHSLIPGGPTPVFLPRKFQTEEPGVLQSMGSQRVGHNWATGHKYSWNILFKALLKTSFLVGCWKMGRNSAARERWGKGHFNLSH